MKQNLEQPVLKSILRYGSLPKDALQLAAKSQLIVQGVSGK